MYRHGMQLRAGFDVPVGLSSRAGKFGRILPMLEPLHVDQTALDNLAANMVDSNKIGASGDNPGVPAGYTFLGQFIDHDISFDPTSLKEVLVDPCALTNYRTPALDLDHLYGRGPDVDPQYYNREPNDRFLIGSTGSPLAEPELRSKLRFDLPRLEENACAVIPDPRNDENLGIAQLHVLFLYFHNAVRDALASKKLVSTSLAGRSLFDQARELVIEHYQWIVLHDFLPRVLDTKVLGRVLRDGSRIFEGRQPFIPVEFSAAAFRFGHSMIRETYDWNRYHSVADSRGLSLAQMFLHSAGSGGFPLVPVPSDCLLDWSRIFRLNDTTRVCHSRNIDPYLAPTLSNMQLRPGQEQNLAKRNLHRGAMLALPSGQSVANFYGYIPLSPDAISKSGLDGSAAADNANMAFESPLWYYILKEAQLEKNGRRLGKVGSRIVAETFVGILRGDPNSFLFKKPRWTPTLPSKRPGHFTMADLIEFAKLSFPQDEFPF